MELYLEYTGASSESNNYNHTKTGAFLDRIKLKSPYQGKFLHFLISFNQSTISPVPNVRIPGIGEDFHVGERRQLSYF